MQNNVSQSPVELLNTLKSLVNQEDGQNLDEIIVQTYHQIKNDYLLEFIEVLYDAVIHMRDPRNIVVYLLNHQNKDFKDSLIVSKFIFFIMENFDLQFNNFYENLLESITVENLLGETEVKSYFIVNFLNNNNKLNSVYMKKIVKKLIKVALESNSQIALIIIYSIMFILRCNPGLYTVVCGEEEFSIQNELEIFSESLKEIAIIVKQIKTEANFKDKRAKIINIGTMKYPQLK